MADNKNLRVKRVRIADGVRDVPLGQAVWENPGQLAPPSVQIADNNHSERNQSATLRVKQPI